MTEQTISNNLNIPQNIDLTTLNRNNNDELIKSTKSYETRLNNKIGEIAHSFIDGADKQNNLIDRLKSTTTAFLKYPKLFIILWVITGNRKTNITTIITTINITTLILRKIILFNTTMVSE